MIAHLQTRLEALYGQERRRNKLGLDGTRALLAALGDPHTKFRSVHVAGTNGKGTTCALIERVLRESGYRTGLYTSPHLVDFRERIRVSGQWADEAWLEDQLDRIESLPEGRDRTFFEVATALGFLYFAEQEVEIAVVEVGLGGRLDCTNVITPEVSVITTVGLDHTEILGATLEEIAREKAGILKPGVPVVPPDASFEEIVARARELGSPIVDLKRYSFHEDMGVGHEWTPLGEHSVHEPPPPMALLNRRHAVLALSTLAKRRGFEIPVEALWTGLAKARWPGRLEQCPTEPRLWWDAAHNAQGMWALRNAWSDRVGFPTQEPRQRHPLPGAVVLALSRDKDLKAVLQCWRVPRPIPLVVTRSRSGRAIDPGEIAREAAAQGIEARIAPDVETGVRVALDSTGDADVLLCGSIFAVGEAMETFGGAPGEWL